ncbi:MAG TPA: S41 family peptidase [Roseiflexaceae bacterium]|nr:S41 family peptidase [Roseiflexaceae bacterium]
MKVYARFGALLALAALLAVFAPAPPAAAVPPPTTPTPVPSDPGALQPDSRGVVNMAAFARLLGAVRFFHPSDAVARTDWDRFAIAYIESVESAGGPAELARRLGDLFRPYAPTLRVFPLGWRGAAEETGPLIDGAQLVEQAPLRQTSALSVTMWVHIPFANGQSGNRQQWSGTRVQAPVQGGQLPRTVRIPLAALPQSLRQIDEATPTGSRLTERDLPLALPGLPLLLDLGGGVWALLPTALLADAQGTLPRGGPLPNLPATPTAPQPGRAVRLAAVAGAWNTAQHFLPYWDVIDTDWDGALLRGLAAASAEQNGVAFADTLRRLLAYTRDGHGTIVGMRPEFHPPSRAPLPLTWDLVEGRLVVTTVEDQNLSVRPGDVVAAIDGVPALEALARKQGTTIPAGAFGRFSALRELASAVPGAPLRLELLPADGRPAYTTTVSPTLLPVPIFPREPRPETVSDLAPGVVYVDLTRLKITTSEELAPLVERLAAAEGLVFDMRGYPASPATVALLSHLADGPLTTAPFLLPVLMQPDQRGVVYHDVSGVWGQPAEPRFTERVAFLLNANGAISYAESVLGIVEKHRLGALVGQPSAGTNGNVVGRPLPGGYQMSWTGLRVTKDSGAPLYGVGVTPTILVERTIAGVAAGRDELLERAIEEVRSKK